MFHSKKRTSNKKFVWDTKMFLDPIAMQKFVWFKKNLFEFKKLFSECNESIESMTAFLVCLTEWNK